MCVHFINDVWHCVVLHIYGCDTACVLTPLIFGPDVLFATRLMDGMPPLISLLLQFQICPVSLVSTFHCHTVKVSTAIVLYIRNSVCFWTSEGFTTWLMIPVICKNFINLFATSFSLSYDSVHPKESYGQIYQTVLLSITILLLMESLPPNAVFLVRSVAIISPYLDIIFSNLCTDICHKVSHCYY